MVVQASTVGTQSFTATVSSDEADPTPGDNSATVSIVVQPVIDLAVAIAANPNPVAVGQNLVYTVSATNLGPDTATDVELNDILPAGATYVSATASLGSPPVLNSGALVAAIGTLTPGAVATVLITVQPTASPGSTLVNSASIAADEYDSNSSNNTATLSVPVRDASNLILTMTPSVSSVPIGQPLGYSIVVANPGPTDEPDALVTIPLPPVVTMVACSADQGSGPSVSPSGILADLGPIPMGASATVDLTVAPLAAALGPLTMTASVQGYNADLAPAQSQASATVTVNSAAGLSISLAPQAAPACQGVNLTYTLTVSNGGPSDASNVVATTPLPTGADFVSATASQGVHPSSRRARFQSSWIRSRRIRPRP